MPSLAAPCRLRHTFERDDGVAFGGAQKRDARRAGLMVALDTGVRCGCQVELRGRGRYRVDRNRDRETSLADIAGDVGRRGGDLVLAVGQRR